MDWNCKHCKKKFDFKTASEKANHSRWCDKNPKSKEHKKILGQRTIEFNKNRNPTNQFISGNQQGHSEKTKKLISKSSKGRKHSIESKRKMSISALNSGHRRLKKNPIVYKGIMMDSNWEVKMAKRLDELGLKWERPKPLKWKDENEKVHNYFPDFYVFEYDVYLDPKNKHAFNVQKKKN